MCSTSFRARAKPRILQLQAGVMRVFHSWSFERTGKLDDDCEPCSLSVAEAAGGAVLPLPHHLGLGGAVQAGYKLAYELGFEFVIRVDGDGQHSAHDIPKMFEVLRNSGVQMVIGSRYIDQRRQYTSPL